MEQTIQNLIGSGMDPKTDNDPYNGFIYTSFQVSSSPQGKQIMPYAPQYKRCACRISVSANPGKHVSSIRNDCAVSSHTSQNHASVLCEAQEVIKSLISKGLKASPQSQTLELTWCRSGRRR